MPLEERAKQGIQLVAVCPTDKEGQFLTQDPSIHYSVYALFQGRMGQSQNVMVNARGIRSRGEEQALLNHATYRNELLPASLLSTD